MKKINLILILLTLTLSASMAQANFLADIISGESTQEPFVKGEKTCYHFTCSAADEKARLKKVRKKYEKKVRKRAEREYNRQNKHPLGSKSSKMHQQKMKSAEHKRRYAEINANTKRERALLDSHKNPLIARQIKQLQKQLTKKHRKLLEKEDKKYQKWIDADPAAFDMYRKDFIKRDQKRQKIAKAIAERIRKEKAIANEIAGQKFLKANAIRIKKIEAELKARTERNFARQKQEALQKIKDRKAFNAAITARMVKKQGEERLAKEKAAKKRH
jgi:hypothetical protein